MRIFHRIWATFLYSGLLPAMPGTWGSLAALILWWFIPENPLIQTCCVLIVIITGTWSAQIYSKSINQKDPGEVVIDEVAGMWLALIFIPHTWYNFLAGFLLFRMLDIFKPGLLGASQELPGGWGIMADDLLAGVITWCVIYGGNLWF